MAASLWNRRHLRVRREDHRHVSDWFTLASAGAFIGALGPKISAAVDSSSKPFHFAANTVFIDAVQDGQTWMVTPHLKMFFCDFTAKDRNVYASCASNSLVDMDLQWCCQVVGSVT
ncbi:hypothetical protein M3I54_41320 [Paraburkholderia sp. CNPSo 3274]|uniref:hypothetical protein n=1 Tax=Paraburkholderia sp. CNPSo 3274 TaxID=2940932 RepID=UPI0020B7647B|nr:hypothetical protein [Paraburkholderia sp. CNPSo 3274]MCP3713234.1 hypothetical protein [Paraburkholderia sp. CNPSo 3274]